MAQSDLVARISLSLFLFPFPFRAKKNALTNIDCQHRTSRLVAETSRLKQLTNDNIQGIWKDHIYQVITSARSLKKKAPLDTDFKVATSPFSFSPPPSSWLDALLNRCSLSS